ncbi:MAG: hypothetical protein Q4B14_00705 [Clostridia bacterium]|nr:hypothetical protein [Clostridia bacterium]
MHSNSFFHFVFTDIIAAVIWHIIIFVLCVKINEKHFDYRKKRYMTKSWEKNGNIYIKYFKIKLWKDHIPQHIGKEGFSKRNVDLKMLNDDEYIERFLLETCRAEWNHSYNCLYAVIAFIISPVAYAVVFSSIVIIFNGACVCIQRYNRIRILNLKARIQRKEVTE